MNLPLRITLLHPPPGVRFRLQSGRTDLVSPTHETPEALTFDFPVRVADRDAAHPPRFLGPFTQGPPTARFVYVNSGKRAAQPDSCWDRRAKIPLGAITWPLIEQTLARKNAVLEVQVEGTGKDGGPVCATVRFTREWRVVNP